MPPDMTERVATVYAEMPESAPFVPYSALDTLSIPDADEPVTVSPDLDFSEPATPPLMVTAISDAPAAADTAIAPPDSPAPTIPPASPVPTPPRIATDRRERLRSVAETIAIPDRAVPQVPPTQRAGTPVSLPATPQPQPDLPTHVIEHATADAAPSPLNARAEDVREPAPQTAIPALPAASEPDTVIAEADTAGTIEATTFAAPASVPPATIPETAALVSEASPPAATTSEPAPAPVPPTVLSNVPSEPDAATETPLTDRILAPTPPAVEAVTPHVPTATPPQTAPAVAEVRAARRPPLAPPAPSSPRPTPPMPSARDVPAGEAQPPALTAIPNLTDQGAIEAVPPTSQAEQRVDDAPVRGTDAPSVAATMAEPAPADDAALRLAALGRRLFGTPTEDTPPASPAQNTENDASPVAAQPTPAPAGNREPVPPAPEPPRPQAPEVLRAEDLFLASDSDRSPQAWMARLTRAAQPSAPSAPLTPTPPAPAPEAAAPIPTVSDTAQTEMVPPQAAAPPFVPASLPVIRPLMPRPPAGIQPAAPLAARRATPATPPPTPLPESVRRFLAPVVGIDPADVPVHRDAPAAAAAAAQRADAITDGTEIALAAGNDAVESPQTLGLIAHELTHVARRRDPLFVPPILRPQSARQSASSPPPMPATATAPITASMSTDEEAVAQEVETRVVQTARTHAPLIEQPDTTATSDSGIVTPTRPTGDMSFPETLTSSSAVRDPWGDLPRPWEPLPAWLTEPSAEPTPTPAPAPVMAGMAVMAAPPLAAAPAIQRAGEERGDAEQATSAPADVSAPQPERPPVEPDLDALSRQIYAILKRRLAAERRSAR